MFFFLSGGPHLTVLPTTDTVIVLVIDTIMTLREATMMTTEVVAVETTIMDIMGEAQETIKMLEDQEKGPAVDTPIERVNCMREDDIKTSSTLNF